MKDINTPQYRRADGSPLRALIVDDEEAIVNLVELSLRFEGWDVKGASTGAAAIALAESFDPDVAVFDIMLPDISGLQLLSRVRHGGRTFPVLFLTALASVDDRVRGLTAGGDDYLTKPFSVEELNARLRALVRRSRQREAAAPNPVLRVADVTLDEDLFEVTRGGEPVELTTTEFELLRYFMRNPNRVLSRSQILDRVWSYDYRGKITVVELYVSYLRKKLDTEGRQPLIHTVRGAGYMLKTP